MVALQGGMNRDVNDLPMSDRPEHLADFEQPPLSEVVLGVQFDPLQTFQSVHFGYFWDCLKEQYPNIRDMPPLAPTFETFGGRRPSVQPQFQMRIDKEIPLPRIWLISSDENDLIQLQTDRFLHNWRSHTGIVGAEYPRYETIRKQFEGELNTFFEFSSDHGLGAPQINQCEISYINEIASDKEIPGLQDVHGDLSSIFSFVKQTPSDDERLVAESLTMQQTSVIKIDNKPVGRLHTKIAPVVSADGNKAIRFELIVRGQPKSESIEDALAFIDVGRTLIVEQFTSMTSTEMHEIWKRNK